MIEHQFPGTYAAANPLIARQLWLLQDTRRRTLEALEGINQLVLDWDYPPGQNAIGTLLYHIAAIEVDWLFVEIREQPDFLPEVHSLFPWDVRDSSGRLIVVQGLSLAEHLERLSQARIWLVETLAIMSLAEYQRPRHFEKYDVTPEWVLHHLMQHEAEHRGEIGLIRILAERNLQKSD